MHPHAISLALSCVALASYLAMHKQGTAGHTTNYQLKHLATRSTLVLAAAVLSIIGINASWPLLAANALMWAAASLTGHCLLEELYAAREEAHFDATPMDYE